MSPRHRSAVTRLLTFFLLPIGSAGCGESTPGGDLVLAVQEISGVGLAGPRAVVHDPVADVYLVSNTNGDPQARDENGFVSRLSPDGEVLALEWIRTTGSESTLHGPRGMALRGDSLMVADMQCVKIYHRESGASAGTRCMEAVSALSGIDVGPEGSLFLTDSGREGEGGALASTGTAGVFRLIVEGTGQGATLAGGPDLGHPVGIAVGNRGIFVATQEPGQILRFSATGDRTTVLSRPAARFEGVVFVGSGFAFTSASDAALYLVDGEGRIHTLLEDLEAPGDPGFDATRGRLLVPLESRDAVLLVDLDLAP